jgi:CDP-paratose 2-epimerase
MHVLVTGSAGLIGAQAVRFYCMQKAIVTGIDNDLRRIFFGEKASTMPVAKALQRTLPTYRHLTIDIRDGKSMEQVFSQNSFDLIIHAAAQPSHEWAIRDPLTDFDINAVSTLQVLELTKRFSPQAVFVFLSTNKVYGDRPNTLPLKELESRYDLPEDHPQYHGIDEQMPIDQCMHSLFGTSKVSADILVQEYARYIGLRTGVFRCGCLTGSVHAGTEMHGFLSHLTKSVVHGKPYTIIGYKGKQVRDNLHAEDVVAAIDAFRKAPRSGEVYNLGGGRERSVSVKEALEIAARITGKKAVTTMADVPRKGDHQWYISSTKKFEKHYPGWRPKWSVERMIGEIASETAK